MLPGHEGANFPLRTEPMPHPMCKKKNSCCLLEPNLREHHHRHNSAIAGHTNTNA
ncbi:uncharacterized protein K460DRAFT_171992 [Cucurbitaria berberidis CBS 394.84]|uniref:Uncharacterized protein n=1 Tax=Cucurbitaria berberidis CBS 394.84 TaxID=1168544 RepID=A0A9P4G9Z1_9PLEO|nr:uncharacterized protein K460DRAFT_171992 [Cucurbitaria berberidis CBS 394.84]KAF1841726.1 hypothetical protein K460DRAFT_171992 [Cucurbitaria berberidis CBS 394.84]